MNEKKYGGVLSRPVPAALFLLAAALIGGAAVLSAVRALRSGARLATGGARWIWYLRDSTEPAPLKFYAERDFDLEAVPAHALAKVFVDRRGVLFVNGSRFEVGEGRPGGALRAFDVAWALRTGRNRILIEAESPTGPGGILFALDLSRRNQVVSNRSWRVALAEPVLRRGEGSPALVWGRPPMWPWRYPGMKGVSGR